MERDAAACRQDQRFPLPTSLWAEIKADDEVCRDKHEVEACQASRSDPSLSRHPLPQPFLCNLVQLLYRGLESSTWGLVLQGHQMSQPLNQGAVEGVAEVRFPQPRGKMYPHHIHTSENHYIKKRNGALTPDTWVNLKKMVFRERGQTHGPTQFIYIKYPEQRLHKRGTQARGHRGWKGRRPGYK